jgi:NAD-dependent SIR2 family protein deacetylase
MDHHLDDHIRAAARLLQQADGLLITAGAGMGVDSGLPDFRGEHGFWKAYPALGRAGTRFVEIANPAAFRDQAERAWGFYGHRLRLYRDTVPHEGFAILRAMASRVEAGCFVFTSNVDGQFQKAGFEAEAIAECHGSIHHLQCLEACSDDIWSAREVQPDIDEEQCLMRSELPRCRHCGGLARPNILMFGDGGWLPSRTDEQYMRLRAWIRAVRRPVVVELGAGTDIPTVRHAGESLRSPLIRINPREPRVARGGDVGIALGALEALRRIRDAAGEAGEGNMCGK